MTDLTQKRVTVATVPLGALVNYLTNRKRSTHERSYSYAYKNKGRAYAHPLFMTTL